MEFHVRWPFLQEKGTVGAIVTDYGWQIDLVSFLTQTLWSKKTWLAFKEHLVYVLPWKYY